MTNDSKRKFSGVLTSGTPTLSLMWIYVLVFLAAGSLYSKPIKNLKYYREPIKKLITFEQYKDAESAIDTLIAVQENSGWGYLYRATLRLTQMVDFGDTLYSAQFHHDIDMADSIFNASLEKTVFSDTVGLAYNYFALASLKALKAQYYNEVVSKPLKAYPFLKDAKNNFDLSLSNYSRLNEARTALAVFDFWQSHVLRFIAWLPLVQDNRESSMKILKRQSASFNENEVSTAISLIWILIEQENPSEALRIGEKLIDLYGPTRSMLEPCGKAAFLLHDYEKAKAYYTSLIRSLERQKRLNKTRIIGALNRLATISNLQKDYPAVVFYAEMALSFDLNELELKKKSKDLKRLAQFKGDAIKAMEK